MKASIQLRDDRKPLLRAKIPVSVLGLPFLSGISAGDTNELRLDLATAFESGPSFRFSYRPNDPWNPFTLAVKTGTGALGSPASAGLTMSAEFGLVGRGGPSFTIQIKPRFGDFCVRRTTSSAPGSSPPPFVLGRTLVVGHGPDGDGSVPGVAFATDNGVFAGKKPNGVVATSVPAAATAGISGLITGAELTARSVLPLQKGTAVKFRWGVKVPPELRSAFMEDHPVGGISLRKLPLLVMSKVSIEHVPREGTSNEKKPAGAAEASLAVQRQLVALQAEHCALRKAVDELRADLGGGRGPSLVTAGVGTADRVSHREGRSHKAWEDDRNGAKSAPLTKNGGRTVGRKGDGKAYDAGGAAAKEDVGEELRKALMGASVAGS